MKEVECLRIYLYCACCEAGGMNEGVYRYHIIRDCFDKEWFIRSYRRVDAALNSSDIIYGDAIQHFCKNDKHAEEVQTYLKKYFAEEKIVHISELKVELLNCYHGWLRFARVVDVSGLTDSKHLEDILNSAKLNSGNPEYPLVKKHKDK